MSRSLIALFVVGLAGCDPVPPELRPDRVLVDSLGIPADAAVREVGVRTVDGAEVAAPARAVMDRRGWLSFRSDDPRPRRIVIDTVALSSELRAWLGDRSNGSPPLLHREARWVLDLRDAPAGELVFRIEGSSGEGSFSLTVPPTD